MEVKKDVLFIFIVAALLIFAYSGVSQVLLISEIQSEELNNEIFNDVDYVMDITDISRSEFRTMYTDISNSLNGIIDEGSIGVTYARNRFTVIFSSKPENVEDVKSVLNNNNKGGHFTIREGGDRSEDDVVIYKLVVSYRQNIFAKLFNSITPRFMIISVLTAMGILVCFPAITNVCEHVFKY